MTTRIEGEVVRAAKPKTARRAAVAPLPAPFPAHAVVIVILAWVLFFVLAAAYSMMAILLLPFLPVFFFGPVCLLTWAHGYAKEARARQPSKR